MLIKVKPEEEPRLRKPALAIGLYMVALSSFIAAIVLNNTVYSEYIGIRQNIFFIYMIIVGLMLVKAVFLTRYKRTQLIITLAIIFIGILSWINSHSCFLFVSLTVIAGSCGISYRRIASCALYITSIAVLIIAAISILGFAENNVLGTRILGTQGEFTRNAFGFRHPNNIGGYILIIFFCFLYLNYRQKKMQPEAYLAWIAIGLSLLFITGNRTGFILLALGLALVFLATLLPKRVMFVVAAVLAGVFIVFGTIMPALYLPTDPTMQSINNLISNRLYLANQYLNNYSCTLFGQPIALLSQYDASQQGVSTMLILDDAYINLYLNYGIAGFIGVIGLVALTFWKSFTNKDTIMCILVALLCAIGITETWFYEIIGALVFSYYFASTSLEITGTSTIDSPPHNTHQSWQSEPLFNPATSPMQEQPLQQAPSWLPFYPNPNNIENSNSFSNNPTDPKMKKSPTKEREHSLGKTAFYGWDQIRLNSTQWKARKTSDEITDRKANQDENSLSSTPKHTSTKTEDSTQGKHEVNSKGTHSAHSDHSVRSSLSEKDDPKLSKDRSAKSEKNSGKHASISHGGSSANSSKLHAKTKKQDGTSAEVISGIYATASFRKTKSSSPSTGKSPITANHTRKPAHACGPMVKGSGIDATGANRRVV